MKRERRLLVAASAIPIVLGFGVRLDAVDFIRGDANSDGVVSISDTHFLLSWIFRGFAEPECQDAADADDNGGVSIADAVRLLGYLVLGREPPASPFPEPGPDPTPADCGSYGSGRAIEDAGAVLEVLDAVAAGSAAEPGGEESLAQLVIAVSSSGAIGGYSGAIRLPPGVAANVRTNARDLSGTFDGGFSAASLDGDLLRFGFLASYSKEAFLPPGELVSVLELTLCLQAGLAAGEYPLALESGELTDYQSGQAISPRHVSGSLIVEREVTTELDCNPAPPERVPVNAVFRLEDVIAPPGAAITVPYLIRADAEIHAYTFSVDFDETLLEATAIEKVWQKPPGTDPEYTFGKMWFDNRNEHPGSAGIDEGFLIGTALFDARLPVGMPANTDNLALRFHLNVKANAPDTPTELRFIDGGQLTGQPVKNVLYSGGFTVTPELAESFLFVDCQFQILPDGAVFIRGDSNQDGGLDVSDPVHTLGHLFLGTGPLLCADAADANDDGAVDLSDPIATLEFLFLGKSALPPPGGGKGNDPTPDGLRCFSSGGGGDR